MALDLHDPWVVLGAVAHATSGIRLGTLVTPISRRRVQTYAKQVVTLDHLSHGRVIVGIGLGFPDEDEFAAFGEPVGLRRRAAITDEALEVLGKLWTGEPVDHQGTHLHVDARLLPATVQAPRPPVWIASLWPSGGSRRRALRWDGIAPLSHEGQPLDAATLPKAVAALGELPAGFEVVASWGPEPLEAFEDAGATWLVESRWPTGDYLDELEKRAHHGPRRNT